MTSLLLPCILHMTAWNYSRNDIVDSLQAMCDKGLTEIWSWLSNNIHDFMWHGITHPCHDF